MIVYLVPHIDDESIPLEKYTILENTMEPAIEEIKTLQEGNQ